VNRGHSALSAVLGIDCPRVNMNALPVKIHFVSSVTSQLSSALIVSLLISYRTISARRLIGNLSRMHLAMSQLMSRRLSRWSMLGTHVLT